MPLNCPVCRAANAAGPACRRCKADLTMLFSLEAGRSARLAAARAAATRGDLPAALADAEEADRARSDAESLRLLAAVHLLRREFARALALYRAAAAAGA